MKHSRVATERECKHCGVMVRHSSGYIWHDDGLIFPQYCISKYDENGDLLSSQLHEPKEQD